MSSLQNLAGTAHHVHLQLCHRSRSSGQPWNLWQHQPMAHAWKNVLEPAGPACLGHDVRGVGFASHSLQVDAMDLDLLLQPLSFGSQVFGLQVLQTARAAQHKA